MLVRFLNRGKTVLKQELLLRRALEERGIHSSAVKIEIDHLNGLCSVNGLAAGVIYPRSFFNAATRMIPQVKDLDFYFNGNMSGAGARREMLRPFASCPRTILIDSNAGRLNFLKAKFNRKYFRGLARARFGLCPHQKDWPGSEHTRWTYRFIECCMVRTIPVEFEEAPLGSAFTDGFTFYSSADALLGRTEYSEQAAESNRAQAFDRFTLSDEFVNGVQSTL